MKICVTCRIEKELTEFSRDKSQKDERNRYCRFCINKYKRKWKKEHREHINESRRNAPHTKNWRYKSKYNLSSAEVENMKNRQNSLCAICGMLCSGLVVDHNHITNKVRALLCPHCNWGIGHFREDVLVLEKAIEYLVEHSEK